MNFLLKYRHLLRWSVLVLTIGFAFGISRLGISFSFEDFYPKDDEEYQYYARYQDEFSEEQNYIVYLALGSPSENIFDQAFLEEADSIFKRLGSLNGVDSILSATSVPQIKRSGLGISRKPYLRFNSENAVKASQRRIEKDSTIVGAFITRDFRYACAYLFIEPEIFDQRDRDVLSQEIEATLSSSGYEYVISGIPFIRSKYVEKIGNELIVFVSLAMFLIVAVLFLSYRNLWGVIIPMVTVLIALVWILGFMGLSGQTINLISNLLIPIMFVVGMSDVIHLTTRYLNELKEGKDRGTAMRDTMREIGFAIFLTSLTTAIGFASLLVSRVPPIRDFGLFAAAGVLFTYFITVVVLPYALLSIDAKVFLTAPSLENSPSWERFFSKIHRFTQTRPKSILAGTVVILGICGWLITQIPLNTFLIEDIGKNDPVRKSMEFFEQNSYGMRPFELGLHPKDGRTFRDQEVLAQLEKMQGFLSTQSYFSPFISPVTVVAQANYLENFNQERYRKVPTSQEKVDEIFDVVVASGGESFMRSVMTEDASYARLSARVPDIGTDAIDAIYARLDSFMVAEGDTTLLSYRPTGHAFLTEHNLKYIRASLMGGLSIAFVIIGILMGLLFRSFRMLAISMLPNVIPLFLTGGVMGLFGISLTASTAIVFVISFGIAVDDTIHFLTRYRLERQLGNTVEDSIGNTIRGTGKAMVMTSLVLLGGFLILLASDFGGTFSVGLFTALTVVFALLSDFLLLPVLLRWVEKARV
ncbi:MAG: MMPL family transporter [Bacteroidota bacterium]